jgi:hypothetical protein
VTHRPESMPFVLFVFECGLAAAILARAVSVMRKRRHFGKTGIALVILFFAGGVALRESLWFSPMLDDGPFRGSPCLASPAGTPDQRFSVGDGWLEVFDARGSMGAPIVRYVDRTGHSSWCIAAEGHEKTVVSTIRFRQTRNWYFRRIVVGDVRWTYGHERTLWYLDRSGALHEYWYSW